MTSLAELLTDLQAEQEALDAIVGSLPAEQWSTPTPAEGYDISDQVWHLAWYDGAACRATEEPEAFAAEGAEAARNMVDYDADVVRRGRELAPKSVLSTWREQAESFRRAARDAGPKARTGWYVTEMALPSLVTARIMETWAHGQDVRDTVGLPPEVTDRLRHVAHLGVRAMPYAFTVNGRRPPTAPVRVELELPSGSSFSRGPQNAPDRVTGPALDFCLVVTQRRHPADVELNVAGATAREWVGIAQAFAGPPGSGRSPGQFPRLAGPT